MEEYERILGKTIQGSQAWWCTSITRALGRMRQKDREFEAILSYIRSSRSALAIGKDSISKNKMKKTVQ
jgi:hypothetical protein